MKRLLSRKLADPAVEAVVQSHAEGITELQNLPMAGMRAITDVVLPDGVEVVVPHKLGRAPILVFTSPVRAGAGTSAGVIFEYRRTGGISGRPVDAAKVIMLAAFGFTNTITVDVMVL